MDVYVIGPKAVYCFRITPFATSASALSSTSQQQPNRDLQNQMELKAVSLEVSPYSPLPIPSYSSHDGVILSNTVAGFGYLHYHWNLEKELKAALT